MRCSGLLFRTLYVLVWKESIGNYKSEIKYLFHVANRLKLNFCKSKVALSYLTIVLSSVDLASLWNVMMTLVALDDDKFSSLVFFLHL